MSEAISPSVIVRLPTAAPARVRQPEYHTRYRMIRKGRATGNVLWWPALTYRSPERRAADAARDAARAEKTAIYEAGGLSRNPNLALIGAALAALSEDQQQTALAMLTMANAATDDPLHKAALTYATELLGALKPGARV